MVVPAGRSLVVGAAIVRAGRLLSCRRTEPAALTGCWELPGGKVEPGEDPRAALARECREELAYDVLVGDRLGADLPLGDRFVFQAFWCALTPECAAEPTLVDHDAARWLAPAELFDVRWLAADLDLVELVRQGLIASSGQARPQSRR